MILPRAATCFLLGLLVSCTTQPTRPPSLGEAYAGPSTLALRRDLAAKSPVAATVKHGDKLEIVEYRHRLVKVRTSDGTEGWTDLRQLLTPDQMAELGRVAENASQAPSQGAATVFELLNMHTEPSRSSPSFWQAPANAKVDVLAHKLTPRIQPAAAIAPPPPKPVPRRKSKDRQKQTKVGPPPLPPAPKPPPNWLALSVPKAEAPQANPEASKPEPKPAASVPMDDWSLVRTADHKAGWVLTRMLSMAIPDEVAQYAEGHRITSYFALRPNQEGDTVKNDWLWTTITKGGEPYEFDSFRVFVWSHRHHRYETAYIERNVTGHYPIEVNTSGAAPSFSLILEGDDGSLVRKTYSFEGFRVRMIHKEPYRAPLAGENSKSAGSAPPPPPAKARSLYARLKDGVRHLFGK
ncbi:MAG TPA: hypothetical protein VEV17_20775 [Bryobacteraceae bacterium]|nr:hypothetical protein [Bryobacteraceae bacterium]